MRTNFLTSLNILLLFTGCELVYDPSFQDDAPSSPGSKTLQRFTYTERVEAPFTFGDLANEMPLSKLLDIALYNNPTTRSSWFAARAAAFGYRTSLSEYYPAIAYQGNIQEQVSNGAASISGAGGAIFAGSSSTQSTGSSTTSTSNTTTQTVETIFNAVTLSYLVLDFGGRDAQAEQAFQVLVASNWQHNQAMQQVILAVINAYTSYLSNKALFEAAAQDLKDAEVTLEAALKMHKYGLATQTDVLSAQSTIQQMRLNVAQSQGAEKNALADLLITLGLPADTNLCLEVLPNKLPVVEISGNISSLIALAKEKRPDIGAAIALVKGQEMQLAISYSAGMPTLTLNGSASRVNFRKPQKPSIYNESIALNWNCPIFEGFYFLNQQKQIRAQIAEAIANVDATVSQIVTEVVASYYAFTTAEAALPASDALLDYSSRAFKGISSQYKVGTSSMIDVLSSLTTLSNARAQQAVARGQWAAALANLAFSVGILEDDSGGWRNHPISLKNLGANTNTMLCE